MKPRGFIKRSEQKEIRRIPKHSSRRSATMMILMKDISTFMNIITILEEQAKLKDISAFMNIITILEEQAEMNDTRRLSGGLLYDDILRGLNSILLSADRSQAERVRYLNETCYRDPESKKENVDITILPCGSDTFRRTSGRFCSSCARRLCLQHYGRIVHSLVPTISTPLGSASSIIKS